MGNAADGNKKGTNRYIRSVPFYILKLIVYFFNFFEIVTVRICSISSINGGCYNFFIEFVPVPKHYEFQIAAAFFRSGNERVIAAALIFVIAGGLIIHFVRNGKDSGTIDTNNTLATQVDECVLQESIAFCGDGVSAKTTKPMSLSTYSETASEEQVVSGNSTTLTLKLISNVLA